MLGKFQNLTYRSIMLLVLTCWVLNASGYPSTALAAGEPAAKRKTEKKIDVFKILVVNEESGEKAMENSYTFAGVIIDRARRVKRNQTDAEVKVVNQMPSGKNASDPFDVIFLIRPGHVEAGEILTLTSDPIESCRGYLKTFLTKTLSSKTIAKAYKGGELKPAEYLTHDLQGEGWLGSCAN